MLPGLGVLRFPVNGWHEFRAVPAGAVLLCRDNTGGVSTGLLKKRTVAEIGRDSMLQALLERGQNTEATPSYMAGWKGHNLISTAPVKYFHLPPSFLPIRVMIRDVYSIITGSHGLRGIETGALPGRISLTQFQTLQSSTRHLPTSTRRLSTSTLPTAQIPDMATRQVSRVFARVNRPISRILLSEEHIVRGDGVKIWPRLCRQLYLESRSPSVIQTDRLF